MTPSDGTVCEILDLFASDVGSGDDYDITWPDDKNAILGHILPSRTFALGATGSLAGDEEISGEYNLRDNLGFTESDYDHSGQWLSDYPARHAYWEQLMISFKLTSQE